MTGQTLNEGVQAIQEDEQMMEFGMKISSGSEEEKVVVRG